ncbi:MAG: tetratricopeptide repeat protein, partial [Planctomycetota bacterium]
DPEMAVKTRFLMAEALFEMAKEHRNLGKTDVADEEIARGKRILEEALRDYPNTSLVSQGEFLLANLAQELQKYPEAIGRYRNVINTWPDSEFAPRSQFKMAQCLEKMENYEQATEEYVRLTYIYPDHPLVAEATARLGNYYYKAKNYDVAGKIFYQFQEKNPEHRLASRALFLAAQCEMKLRNFHEAIARFGKLIDAYQEESDVRAEAMYWMGDCYHNVNDYMNAYRTFKRLTWDYPETKWAKIARGRLTEEAYSRIED